MHQLLCQVNLSRQLSRHQRHVVPAASLETKQLSGQLCVQPHELPALFSSESSGQPSPTCLFGHAQADGQHKPQAQQAHCKWKNKSYTHCSWVPLEQLRMLQEKLPAVKRRLQQWFRAPKSPCEVRRTPFAPARLSIVPDIWESCGLAARFGGSLCLANHKLPCAQSCLSDLRESCRVLGVPARPPGMCHQAAAKLKATCNHMTGLAAAQWCSQGTQPSVKHRLL